MTWLLCPNHFFRSFQQRDCTGLWHNSMAHIRHRFGNYETPPIVFKYAVSCCFEFFWHWWSQMPHIPPKYRPAAQFLVCKFINTETIYRQHITSIELFHNSDWESCAHRTLGAFPVQPMWSGHSRSVTIIHRKLESLQWWCMCHSRLHCKNSSPMHLYTMKGTLLRHVIVCRKTKCCISWD